MPFDSLTFLVLFLPVSLIVYYLFPPRSRNGVLLLFSLLFLLISDFSYALILLASGVTDWLIGRKMAQATANVSKRWLFIAIGKNGLLLLTVKQYAAFPDVFYSNYPALNLLIPLGLCVYFFKSISYLADLHTGAAAPQRTPFGLWLYLFFYPALPFGPAVRYRDFVPFLDSEKRFVNADSFLYGGWSLAKGIFQTALPAQYLLNVWQNVSNGNISDGSMLSALCALICAAFGVYFLWSGAQNAAQGLASLYGFSFPKSNSHPLTATGLHPFIHKTDCHLDTWMESYVYSPLIAGDNRLLRGIVHLIFLLSFRSFFRCDPLMLAVWGIGILLILLLEHTLARFLASRKRDILCRVYVWSVLLVCIMLFLLPAYEAFHGFIAMLTNFGQIVSFDTLLDEIIRPLLIFGVCGILLGYSNALQKSARKILFYPIHGKPWLLLPASLLLLACSLIFI